MKQAEKFALLATQPWEQIIKEVTVYAIFQFRYWGLVTKDRLKGYTPEEVVMEAIEKVYSGEWQWKPEKSALIPYLKYHVVKGLVANLARNKQVNLNASVDVDSLNVASEAASAAEEMNARQVLDYLKDKITDAESMIVFDGLMEGVKRREICAEQGWEGNIYDNALKRLHNMLKHLEISKHLL